MIANVTAGRALQALDAIHQYVDSTAAKQLYQELVGTYDGSNITPVVTQADIAVSKTRRTDQELEHVDIFCAARDYQFGQRSRRYIYQQAQQEKLRYAYELFMLFVRENTGYDVVGIATEGAANPAALTELTLPDYQQEEFTL